MNIAGRSHDYSGNRYRHRPLPGALHSASRLRDSLSAFFRSGLLPSLLDRSGSDDIYRKYIAPVFENRLQFPEHIVPHSAWQQELLTLLYSIRDLFAEKVPGFELQWSRPGSRKYSMRLPPAPFPHSRQNRRRQSAHHIKPVLAYLQKNYRVRSVSGSGGSCAYERGHLCRLFRSVTG